MLAAECISFSPVAAEVARSFSQHVAEIWEELARASVPRLRVGGQNFGVASRWWGTGLDRAPLEIDIVAESEDGRSLLLGEAKWSEKTDAPRLRERLKRSAENLPFVKGRKVILALWLKRERRAPRVKIFSPRHVLALLR
jgi:hypothetical protein